MLLCIAAGLAPQIEIQSSSFAADLKKLMEDANYADIQFHFHEDTTPLKAHKLILISASNVFRDILSTFSHSSHSFPEKFVDNVSCSCTRTNRAAINESTTTINCNEEVDVTFSSSVSRKNFEYVLEFLYTGMPGFGDNPDKIIVAEVSKLAQMFHLSWLSQICANIFKEEEFLNPSIGTYLNDETGQTLKSRFMDKQTLADVVFAVEGRQIYGHKAVLMARSSVMSAMVGGQFIEGLTGEVSFFYSFTIRMKKKTKIKSTKIKSTFLLIVL